MDYVKLRGGSLNRGSGTLLLTVCTHADLRIAFQLQHASSLHFEKLKAGTAAILWMPSIVFSADVRIPRRPHNTCNQIQVLHVQLTTLPLLSFITTFCLSCTAFCSLVFSCWCTQMQYCNKYDIHFSMRKVTSTYFSNRRHDLLMWGHCWNHMTCQLMVDANAALSMMTLQNYGCN